MDGLFLVIEWNPLEDVHLDDWVTINQGFMHSCKAKNRKSDP